MVPDSELSAPTLMFGPEVLLPFIGIKAIDMVIVALRLA